MVIANPIYDVVFKRMMENEKVAKFFIGTLINETIESIEVKPQEYTYEGEFDFNDPKDVEKYENRLRERHSIWVYRLDFIAIFTNKNGEQKKVLIEIQKARNEIDLMRFRNYLAEQYKKQDTINDERVVLPVTTIYILGFKLPEVLTPCLKVERVYKDLISNTTIQTKSDFIEKLTHDSYVVQVDRITNRYHTTLDKLLSVFEQTNFVDDDKIIKEYTHETDVEELKIITDILHYSGTNPTEKKKIETEQEAWRTINALFKEKEKKYKKALEEKEKIIAKINQDVKDKDQAILDKDQTILDKDKLIEELLLKLNANK
jgi:molybdopterin converting factor small subunit